MRSGHFPGMTVRINRTSTLEGLRRTYPWIEQQVLAARGAKG